MLDRIPDGDKADLVGYFHDIELVIAEASGPPYKRDETKFAEDRWKLRRQMKDCLDVLLEHVAFLNRTNSEGLAFFGLQVYLFTVTIFVMEKRGVYRFHEVLRCQVPAKMSNYNKLRYCLNAAWSLRALVSRLVEVLDIDDSSDSD